MAEPEGRLLEEDKQDLTVWDEASTSEAKSDHQADEDTAKVLLGMTGRCHETGVGERARTPEPGREKDLTQKIRKGEHNQWPNRQGTAFPGSPRVPTGMLRSQPSVVPRGIQSDRERCLTLLMVRVAGWST